MAENKKSNQALRAIPGVHLILDYPEVKQLINTYNRELITYTVRCVLDRFRENIRTQNIRYSRDVFLAEVRNFLHAITHNSLKPVINATGIILHTNLGRAPLGEKIADEIKKVVVGYANVEYDLSRGKRSNRNVHCAELLKYITTAPDVLVVNNNAAGIYLILHTFAAGREVIISRGELIEIGGSFRIPDIMIASGAVMREVGTTNKTRLKDYEEAVNEHTALIFKAHKSNFTMSGFTEEASIDDLAHLARDKALPFVYDIGSGLLRKPEGLPLDTEPDVQSAIARGADLVTFSGDKLLGGPQAGIVAGRSDLISLLKSAPLMRVLRVGKLTLAALSGACRNYLDQNCHSPDSPVFAFMNRNKEYVYTLAQHLNKACQDYGIATRIVSETGRCGGGTLPDFSLQSSAVELLPFSVQGKAATPSHELVFHRLLLLDVPIIGIIKEGSLRFNLFTVMEKDIPSIAQSIAHVITGCRNAPSCKDSIHPGDHGESSDE